MKRAYAALAFVVALASWWALSRGAAPPAPPAAPPAAELVPAIVKPKPAPRVPDMQPPPAARGAALRERGEALGGTPPSRVESSTSTNTP